MMAGAFPAKFLVEMLQHQSEKHRIELERQLRIIITGLGTRKPGQVLVAQASYRYARGSQRAAQDGREVELTVGQQFGRAECQHPRPLRASRIQLADQRGERVRLRHLGLVHLDAIDLGDDGEAVWDYANQALPDFAGDQLGLHPPLQDIQSCEADDEAIVLGFGEHILGREPSCKD